ncbi:putative lipoprotein, partial [Chlamydia psittaci 06-1683]
MFPKCLFFFSFWR